MAEHVVAGGNGGGDVDGRREGVLDELVRGPSVGRGIDDRVLLDLDPFEGGLVGGGAVTGALSEVVDDLCNGVSL